MGVGRFTQTCRNTLCFAQPLPTLACCMSARRRKKAREQDATRRYLAGDMDEDAVEHEQRFSDRNKNAQQDKILKTSAMRAAAEATASAIGETDLESLPIGQVFQVYSLFCEVMHDGTLWLCTT